MDPKMQREVYRVDHRSVAYLKIKPRKITRSLSLIQMRGRLQGKISNIKSTVCEEDRQRKSQNDMDRKH